MKYRILALASVLLVCTLQGCISLPRATVTADDFQAAMATRDYRRAEKLLQRLTAESADDEITGLGQQLALAVQARQAEVVSQVEQLLAGQRWHKALRALANLQLELPESEELQAKVVAIEAARDEYIEQLQLQLVLYRAEQLPRQLQLLEDIRRADPRKLLVTWQLGLARQSGYKLVAELLACAEASIREADSNRADSCLGAAQPIANSLQGAQISAAQRLIAVKKQNSRPALVTAPAPALAREDTREQELLKKQQLYLQLQAEYQDAMAAGWWLSARDKLDELAAGWPGDQQLQRRRAELDRLIKREVSRQLRRGQHLYSHGEIEQALRVWRSVKPLDPDNATLLAYIARAKKFLAKLNQLENE